MRALKEEKGMKLKMKTDIYTLAHEIKNPLCVAKGYLEMMNEDNFQKYKGIIEEEITNSISILDNYMNLGSLSLNKEEMDINLLLLDIKRSMKEYLKKKNIALRIKTIDDEVYLNADYQKLKEVFYNILKNSVEAKAKNINISYAVLYDKIVITISNDGNFLDEETINNIGNNYTNKILGHGIGTTLSKKIIELHQGKIEYINDNNKGVNVIITLPLE
jgi:signal transduction histidine kinase